MAVNRSTALALLVATTLTSGCTFGTHVRNMPHARTAIGATVEAEAGGQYTGELLWVRDDGVVVLTQTSRVVLIRWAVADHIRVRSLKLNVRGQEPPVRYDHERLRLSSRHPYGLTDAQMRDVLARYKQTDLDEAKR